MGFILEAVTAKSRLLGNAKFGGTGETCQAFTTARAGLIPQKWTTFLSHTPNLYPEGTQGSLWSNTAVTKRTGKQRRGSYGKIVSTNLRRQPRSLLDKLSGLRPARLRCDIRLREAGGKPTT